MVLSTLCMNQRSNHDESLSQRGNPGSALYLARTWRAVRRALQLSPRELDIAQAVFDDLSETLIAKRHGISVHTVHTYLKRLYQKLGARSRVEVVLVIVAAAHEIERKKL